MKAHDPRRVVNDWRRSPSETEGRDGCPPSDYQENRNKKRVMDHFDGKVENSSTIQSAVQGYNGIGGSRITPELNNLLGQSETPTPPLIEVASPGSAREASGSSNRYGGSKRFVSARGGLAGPSGGSSDLLIWENLLRNELLWASDNSRQEPSSRGAYLNIGGHAYSTSSTRAGVDTLTKTGRNTLHGVPPIAPALLPGRILVDHHDRHRGNMEMPGERVYFNGGTGTAGGDEKGIASRTGGVSLHDGYSRSMRTDSVRAAPPQGAASGLHRAGMPLNSSSSGNGGGGLRGGRGDTPQVWWQGAGFYQGGVNLVFDVGDYDVANNSGAHERQDLDWISPKLRHDLSIGIAGAGYLNVSGFADIEKCDFLCPESLEKATVAVPEISHPTSTPHNFQAPNRGSKGADLAQHLCDVVDRDFVLGYNDAIADSRDLHIF